MILLFLALAVLPAQAQDFRRQGPNPWCYAYAEEQVMKDVTCTENCENNANQWVYSIFDIVKAHDGIDKVGTTQTLPFQTTWLRHSRCTLEQPLFRMSGSAVLNPGDWALPAHLRKLFQRRLRLSKAEKDEAQRLDLGAMFRTLSQIAINSQDADQFVKNVIDFSICDETVGLPNTTFEQKIVSDPKVIRAHLDHLLAKKKSFILGVCADDLRADTEQPCPTGHAIVVKERNGDMIRVIDSRFTIMPFIDSDGSVWIPIDRVIRATAHFGRILAEDRSRQGRKAMSAYMESQKIGFQKIHQSLQGAEQRVDQILLSFQNKMIGTPSARLRPTFISLVNISAAESKVKVDQQLLRDIRATSLKTVDDIAKLKPAILDWYNRILYQRYAISAPQVKLSLAHNLIWFN